MIGKIVLLPFPFTDITITKRRPALVILERPNDIVVMFISSKIPKAQEKHHIMITKRIKRKFNKRMNKIYRL